MHVLVFVLCFCLQNQLRSKLFRLPGLREDVLTQCRFKGRRSHTGQIDRQGWFQKAVLNLGAAKRLKKRPQTKYTDSRWTFFVSTFWAAGWPPLSMLFSSTYDEEAVGRLMANLHLITLIIFEDAPFRNQALPEMQGQSRETTKNENNTYPKQGDKSPIGRKIVFCRCLRQ